MFVSLTADDLRKILKEKFGEAVFEISYFESNKEWSARTGRRLSDFNSQAELEKISPFINLKFHLNNIED